MATAFVATLLAVVNPTAAGAITPPYRRWAAGKTYTCVHDSSGYYVTLNNQNVEFNGLSASDRYLINYIDNGAYTTNGPYPVEKTSGTQVYGAFAEYFDSFPFTFQFRIDTLVNGSVVYTSELKVTCTGASSGTVNPTNTVVATSPYRRWKDAKTYHCTTLGGGGVAVDIDDQNIEFNNLPVGAQSTIHYIDNGVDTPSGPYAVEQANGSITYGAFEEDFTSYPFTFEFRLDTIIGGKVTYTSKLVITCTGNGTGTVTPINAVVDPAPFATWSAFVMRQYSDLTNSTPSASSLSSWVTKLSTGAKTKGELIDALRKGTDNTSHVDPVVRLYRAFLQRTPDSGGLKFWIARHRSGAWNLNRIAQYFATSSEFITKYGHLTNKAFVTRIYTDVLERTADSGGVTYWTKQLDTGHRNRGTVMVGFSESSEYKRKQAENTDAAVAHIFLLGHAPSTLELNGWVSRQKAGMSQAELAKEMLTSAAYATHIGS